MRVIAGKARGHKLISPEGVEVRPTSDRVKESIFNIIQSKLSESKIVDFFSGTGNLGIEALSRGASKAYFVDKSPKSIKVVRENLEKTRLIEQAEILNVEAETAVSVLSAKGLKADVIFMDPPYLKGLEELMLEKIALHGLLADEGIIVVEHDRTTIIKEDINKLTRYRRNDYGNTSVSFYCYREEEKCK